MSKKLLACSHDIKKEDPLEPLHKTGFWMGLIPKRIVGVNQFNNQTVLFMKWRGIQEPEPIYYEEANAMIPQMVTKYYESKKTWKLFACSHDINKEDPLEPLHKTGFWRYIPERIVGADQFNNRTGFF